MSKITQLKNPNQKPSLFSIFRKMFHHLKIVTAWSWSIAVNSWSIFIAKISNPFKSQSIHHSFTPLTFNIFSLFSSLFVGTVSQHNPKYTIALAGTATFTFKAYHLVYVRRAAFNWKMFQWWHGSLL